jgi:5-methylcytosine-specific restriction endonuclease McrA
MKSRPRLKRLAPRVASVRLALGSEFPDRRDEGAQRRKHFYDSVVWQRTREAKLRRDPLCQCCAYEGTVTQAAHVDHWLPLAEGGHPTADDNLVSLCVPCHSRKTLFERNGTQFPKIAPSQPRRIAIA